MAATAPTCAAASSRTLQRSTTYGCPCFLFFVYGTDGSQIDLLKVIEIPFRDESTTHLGLGRDGFPAFTLLSGHDHKVMNCCGETAVFSERICSGFTGTSPLLIDRRLKMDREIKVEPDGGPEREQGTRPQGLNDRP